MAPSQVLVISRPVFHTAIAGTVLMAVLMGVSVLCGFDGGVASARVLFSGFFALALTGVLDRLMVDTSTTGRMVRLGANFLLTAAGAYIAQGALV